MTGPLYFYESPSSEQPKKTTSFPWTQRTSKAYDLTYKDQPSLSLSELKVFSTSSADPSRPHITLGKPLPPVPRLRSAPTNIAIDKYLLAVPRSRSVPMVIKSTILRIEDPSFEAIQRGFHQRQKHLNRRRLSSIQKIWRGRKCKLCEINAPIEGHFGQHLLSRHRSHAELHNQKFDCKICN